MQIQAVSGILFPITALLLICALCCGLAFLFHRIIELLLGWPLGAPLHCSSGDCWRHSFDSRDSAGLCDFTARCHELLRACALATVPLGSFLSEVWVAERLRGSRDAFF